MANYWAFEKGSSALALIPCAFAPAFFQSDWSLENMFCTARSFGSLVSSDVPEALLQLLQ
jgi:hypothetical protein